MCGIIGVLNMTNRSPVDGERLRAGRDAMYHRGPDDEGVFLQPDFGLAARRLSIVDLSGGHQPMSNEKGTVHVACNGEIYNHAVLRRELEGLGHSFRTNADTEALLHGYEEWGHEGLLRRLRGMFAFAVWDGDRQMLLLARDRMGIKPLYFSEYEGRLYFASEISPLMIHSGMPRRVNLPALEIFLTVGFVTSPHTMFEGIQKLPPAHYIVVRNGRVSRHKYWELSYETTSRGSETSIIEEFKSRLQECVETHLMSDVPVGALLSGGVDSTTTVALMRKAMKEPFQTVTIGFEDGGLDEAEFATESARALGTHHHSLRFTGDSMADYPSILRRQEEPFARPTHVALYHVFRACRELGLKVVVTGEGADELFGGYSWHQSGFFERALSRMPLRARGALERNAAMRALGRSGRRWVRILRGVPTQVHDIYRSMIRVTRTELAQSVLSQEVRSALRDGASREILDAWSDWLPCVDGASEFEQVLWIQSRTRMPDYINHNLDRTSMAHSVEARPPFLDHELWEFCASIPVGLKLRNSTEKYLLRAAGKGVVPEAARVRPKAPLRVPYYRWVAQPRLPHWAEDALGAERLNGTALFDATAVHELRREVQAGNLGKATLLMSILTTQVWSRIFLESPLTPIE